MTAFVIVAIFVLVPAAITYGLARCKRQHMALWIAILTGLAFLGAFSLETALGQGMFRYVLSFGLLLPATIGSILGLFIGSAPWKKTPDDTE